MFYRSELVGVAVKQVVVATTHFVLLMDDGRVYRIPYSLTNELPKEKRCDQGVWLLDVIISYLVRKKVVQLVMSCLGGIHLVVTMNPKDSRHLREFMIFMIIY